MKDKYITNDTRKDSIHRQLLDLIPEGFENAVSVTWLADKMKTSEKDVLGKIRHAQFDGNIIAVLENGVCIPADESELYRCVGCEVADLQFRIEALNHAYKKLTGEQLILVYRSEDYEE